MLVTDGGWYYLRKMIFHAIIVIVVGSAAVASGFVLRHGRFRSTSASIATSTALRSQMGHYGMDDAHAGTYHRDMFCNQCEQTNNGVACTVNGVCGKDSETAACQDALTEIIKGVGVWAVTARAAGATEEEMKEANEWTLRAAFSTLTNVNFNEDRIADFFWQGAKIKKDLENVVRRPGGELFEAPKNDPTDHKSSWIQRIHDHVLLVDYDFEKMTIEKIEEFGHLCQIPFQEKSMGDVDAFSLYQAALYGLRGLCAYECHNLNLDNMDTNIMKDVHEIWAKLASKEPDTEGLLATVLRVGEVNLKVMKGLDHAHAVQFGTPEPTKVRKTPVKGKAILISGHDIPDCYELLKQTEGKGVKIYTHGEELPAHAYPKLKQFGHFAGHFGTGWQNQKVHIISSAYYIDHTTQ